MRGTPASRRTTTQPRAPRANTYKRRTKKKNLIRRAAIFIAVLTVLILAYFGLMSWKVMAFWRASHGAPADCMIVLGAAEWNGSPSPAMRERLDIALKAYKDKLAPRIIVSGGVGLGELSEAEVMKAYLVKHGIPDKAVLLEDKSHSTIENLTNSRAIMQKQGYQTAIIVTHGFHAYRASLMAKSLGIPATVDPVQIRPIDLQYYVIRECAGIAYFVGTEWLAKAFGT